MTPLRSFILPFFLFFALFQGPLRPTLTAVDRGLAKDMLAEVTPSTYQHQAQIHGTCLGPAIPND